MRSTKKAALQSTKSKRARTTATATATASSSKTGRSLKRRATRSSPPLKDGKGRAPSSRTLSDRQLQLLLGTMLGDGNLQLPKTARGTPQYRSQHGYVQHSYNTAKYQTLSEFVNHPPKKTRNYGYGKWSSRWQTRNCPELRPIASLCCPFGKKLVSQEWLNQLTWEGIAWWYQDDGSLQKKAGGGSETVTLHTQGFSEPEVDLLVSWLQTTYSLNAYKLKLKRRHKKSGFYWIIKLDVPSTQVFIENVRPYVVSAMSYKVALVDRKDVGLCNWCSRTFPLRATQARYVENKNPLCCGRTSCRKKKRKAAVQKFDSDPLNRAGKLAKQAARYKTDQSFRRYHSEKSTEWREANPERFRAIKQKHLAKKRAERQQQVWTCQRCEHSEPLGEKDPKTKYCSECRKIVTREIKSRSAANCPRLSK